MAERIPSLEAGQPCSVYVLRDAEGVPLYIGKTARGMGRMCNHTSQPWWPEVASVLFEHFPGRLSAGRREYELIRTLRPVHNIHGRPDGEPVVCGFARCADQDTVEFQFSREEMAA